MVDNNINSLSVSFNSLIFAENKTEYDAESAGMAGSGNVKTSLVQLMAACCHRSFIQSIAPVITLGHCVIQWLQALKAKISPVKLEVVVVDKTPASILPQQKYEQFLQHVQAIKKEVMDHAVSVGVFRSKGQFKSVYPDTAAICQSQKERLKVWDALDLQLCALQSHIEAQRWALADEMIQKMQEDLVDHNKITQNIHALLAKPIAALTIEDSIDKEDYMNALAISCRYVFKMLPPFSENKAVYGRALVAQIDLAFEQLRAAVKIDLRYLDFLQDKIKLYAGKEMNEYVRSNGTTLIKEAKNIDYPQVIREKALQEHKNNERIVIKAGDCTENQMREIKQFYDTQYPFVRIALA
jgi:hypothetical protein